jgi:hypothetical protein
MLKFEPCFSADRGIIPAHEAGFADSAHFSRTFRRHFGLPAASLQVNGRYRPAPST